MRAKGASGEGGEGGEGWWGGRSGMVGRAERTSGMVRREEGESPRRPKCEEGGRA